MLRVFRPSIEVVRDGRILYYPKDVTRLNLVDSGTFSVEDKKDCGRIAMDILPETFKTT
jgi:hypothetical protein